MVLCLGHVLISPSVYVRTLCNSLCDSFLEPFVFMCMHVHVLTVVIHVLILSVF